LFCTFRCFLEKSLVDPEEDALAQSEHEIFSKIFEDCDEETPSLDCQSIFVEGSHSEGDEYSKSADKTKVFPQGYYSTPCAKLRFNSLYGNEVLNKTVKHNDFSYMRKYKDGKITTDYQGPSSAMSREFDIDPCYEYDIEDTNDNVNLKSYSLLHSPTNATSPVSSKGDHDSINAATILSSSSSSAAASSPSYSSINICSDRSTEDERSLISNKRKFDSDYTSENRFLHPLVNFKSKQWKARNSETNLLHTVRTRNVSHWKSECEYTVSNSKCINSNNDQMFSIGNLSSIYRKSNSDTLHDEAHSSADLTFSYRMKYTRRAQTITLSTQPFGLPDSAQ
jgi:hypothetical protein